MHNMLVIGGNADYGMLRNIKQALGAQITIIRTSTVRVSAGNHMCKEVYEVPFFTDTTYIPTIKRICDKHSLSLIIPSTDYETFVLASHQQQLPTVAVSPASTNKIFLDKYISYEHLTKADLSFAESILPSNFNNNFTTYIVKPREGRGSRNIYKS